MNAQKIRNIAIIAHVDHGKTTLVDALLRQCGTFRSNERLVERVLDSGDIEKERGITILAKNTAVTYDDVLINIVDTPGHADFGGEVERVLDMVDSAVLLVDAAEGPMPQTKFVLGKALAQGLRPIVLINKIDRSDARPVDVLNETFDLFASLGATDEQLDFPALYAVGVEGWVSDDYRVKTADCSLLLKKIIEHVPPPQSDPNAPFALLATTIEKDPYVGRMVTGRIHCGCVKVGMTVKVLTRTGHEVQKGRITKILAFRGISRQPIEEAFAGDIVAIAGLSEVFVSHTVCDVSVQEPLSTTPIDPPTLSMEFTINDSPLSGREGEKLTSREIRDRLFSEAEVNVGLHVEQGTRAESFIVKGRGELQLAVLIETMRREGFELSVARPQVIMIEQDGKTQEPYEEVVIDVDADYAGVVMEKMGGRKAELVNMIADHHGKQRLVFEAPSRGMIGYRSEFMMDTRGTGVLTRQFARYAPVRSVLQGRHVGVLVSLGQGDAVAYALDTLQDRGTLFISPGTPVYDGMIIGENSRSEDMEVNPLKAKQLTNVRASGKDEAIRLSPPREMNLELCLSYIDDDELVEVTPKSIRLRKKGLNTNARKRMKTK